MILPAIHLLAIAFFQTAPSATIVFGFEDAQLQPAAYSIEVHEDGTGRYKSTPAPPTPETTISSPPEDNITPPAQDREIRIGDSLRAELFAAARSHHFFAITCEPNNSHVAFTGKKTFTYSGADGHGSCTYNYARDPELNRLAVDMIAVAFTLEEGQKLAIEHQHSRLALDAELESLQDAARDGRALEIQNITPQLKAIAEDEEVLLRARKRANALLAGAAAPAH
jgi:hypothetical protein